MNYYAERFLQAAFTVWATLTVTFALTRWMPGGPMDFIRAQLMAGNLATGGGQLQDNTAQLERFNKMAELYVNMQPDEPLHLAYISYMSSVLRGDFGQSIWYSEPVMSVLGPAIPWTLFIVSIGIIVSFVTRVLFGAALAYYEGSNVDYVGTISLLWIQALPYFIVGLLTVYFFGYQLQWFPIGGRMDASATVGLNWPFVSGIINHAALPVLSLAWASFGAGAIAMRANSIQVLGEDYLRVARLRGLMSRRLTTRYVGRNAVLPMYTQMLIQIGFMIGGAILVESIFNYRGVGFYMWRGIQARDYPLLMGGFILITISVVIALLIADLTYGLIDPRIGAGDSDEAF